jgi:hypothetical protein
MYSLLPHPSSPHHSSCRLKKPPDVVGESGRKLQPSDVQQIFDNMLVKDKKLFWIEGTTRRWDGYNYFPKHPEQTLEWFDTHMRCQATGRRRSTREDGRPHCDVGPVITLATLMRFAPLVPP